MSEQRHLPIKELDCFLLFEEVADWAWGQVEAWKPRHQDTIGKQLIRAADSVGANLVEGDGRYSGPDAVHFFIIARASARECRLWIKRAAKRHLVSEADADRELEKIVRAAKLLNLLINYRRRGSRNGKQVVREQRATYSVGDPLAELLEQD